MTTCTRFTPEDRRALAAILRSQEKILSVLTELTAAVDEYLIWLWRNEPQRYRQPARPVVVKPTELPKAPEHVQERFL